MKYIISISVGENSSSLITYEEEEEKIFDRAKALLLLMSTTSDSFNCTISSCLENLKNKEKHCI